jgi:hypothetical protein
MSAGAELQEAVATTLLGQAQLTGVYDGPPARAVFPYVVLDGGTELDWSHKSGRGREVLLAVTLWDEQPARLHAMIDGIEAAVEGIDAVSGWRLASIAFLRRRIVRDVAGPWAAAVDFRVRLLAD